MQTRARHEINLFFPTKKSLFLFTSCCFSFFLSGVVGKRRKPPENNNFHSSVSFSWSLLSSLRPPLLWADMGKEFICGKFCPGGVAQSIKACLKQCEQCSTYYTCTSYNTQALSWTNDIKRMTSILSSIQARGHSLTLISLAPSRRLPLTSWTRCYRCVKH